MRQVNLQEAVEVLRRGQILVYPTETLYGLGVDANSETALKKVFALKGRSESKAISVLIAGPEQIQPLVTKISIKLLKTIDKFFPGPLTLVLPASPQVYPALHGGTGWIGIRQSSHPLAQALVENFGGPVTTTSANLSGAGGAHSLAQISRDFAEDPDVFLLAGGELKPSKGSTVVRVSDDAMELLREGEIPFREIEDFFMSLTFNE